MPVSQAGFVLLAGPCFGSSCLSWLLKAVLLHFLVGALALPEGGCFTSARPVSSRGGHDSTSEAQEQIKGVCVGRASPDPSSGLSTGSLQASLQSLGLTFLVARHLAVCACPSLGVAGLLPYPALVPQPSGPGSGNQRSRPTGPCPSAPALRSRE